MKCNRNQLLEKNQNAWTRSENPKKKQKTKIKQEKKMQSQTPKHSRVKVSFVCCFPSFF